MEKRGWKEGGLRWCPVARIYRATAVAAPGWCFAARHIRGCASAIAVRHPGWSAVAAAGHPCRSASAGIIDLWGAAAAVPAGGRAAAGGSAESRATVATAAAGTDELLIGFDGAGDGTIPHVSQVSLSSGCRVQHTL
jgi:hypothetical protein